MIILDTNVVSALMVDEPDPSVIRWLNRQPGGSVWTTAVTIYELRVAIELLPTSRKRRALEEEFARLVHDDLQSRVLSLDVEAAQQAAALAARRRLRGTPMEIRDTMIAGISISRLANLATRNVRHFADLDISVVDPWAG